MHRFKIMDITVYKDYQSGQRYDIRYFDTQNYTQKYGVVSVAVDMYGHSSQMDLIQHVAKKAATKVGSNEFYYAMREYVMKNMHYDKWGNPSYMTKKDHMHYDILGVDEYVKAKEHYKKYVTSKYAGPVKNPAEDVITKKPESHLSSGLNLNEIDLLPGLSEYVKHPVESHQSKIKDIIIDLNDNHGWSRERVADWLETLDVDLRFRSPDDILREKEEKERKAKLDGMNTALNASKDKLKALTASMKMVKEQIKEFEKEIKKLLEEAENGI